MKPLHTITPIITDRMMLALRAVARLSPYYRFRIVNGEIEYRHSESETIHWTHLDDPEYWAASHRRRETEAEVMRRMIG